jgi:hypothetical protein
VRRRRASLRRCAVGPLPTNVLDSPSRAGLLLGALPWYVRGVARARANDDLTNMESVPRPREPVAQQRSALEVARLVGNQAFGRLAAQRQLARLRVYSEAEHADYAASDSEHAGSSTSAADHYQPRPEQQDYTEDPTRADSSDQYVPRGPQELEHAYHERRVAPGPAPGPSSGRDYAPGLPKPDFSGDSVLGALPPLEPGDHVWYWQGNVSMGQGIPRLDKKLKDGTIRKGWFPNASPAKTSDYQDHGGEIYNFVVYANEVRCAQPQMGVGHGIAHKQANFPGSYAWVNHNPGNLSGPTAEMSQLKGTGGQKLNGAPPDTPTFLTFPDDDTGFGAIRPWLENNGHPRYVTMSVWDAWGGYDIQDRATYVPRICAAAGIKPETVLQTLSKDQWDLLTTAIKKEEGTLEGWTYSRSDPQLPTSIRQAL